MYCIIVQNSRGETKSEPFQKLVVTVGKSDENDIPLEQQGISRKHARFLRDKQSPKFYIEDLNSTNGTFVNTEKVQGRRLLEIGETVRIGTFALTLQLEQVEKSEKGGEGNRAGTPTGETRQQESGATQSLKPSDMPGSGGSGYTYQELIKEIHNHLIEIMDLRRMSFDKIGAEALKEKTRTAVIRILDEMKDKIPANISRQELLKDVLNEALGLGPLEDLLADNSISEVMVNRADQIFIERKGKMVLSEKKFSSNAAVLQVIERIVSPIGRRIDESSPLVDARLKDGSRVNAIIPPLALKGPCITIRKFSSKPLQPEDLIRFGSVTSDMIEFLKIAVKFRKNIVISGGTGSGKTTLLNVISSFIPSDERIVTVEDAAEIQLPQEHVVSLESKPANIEGKGAITIRTLVKNCLRMRPDRIVVGECRGGEALDMLQAMNTGHDGSLTTLHANNPSDAMLRLETLVLMAGMDLPVSAIRQQIASAVNIVVQQTRFPCGTRKVTRISEITGIENGNVCLQDIFMFKQRGYDQAGKINGDSVPTGTIPHFYEEMRERRIPVNTDIFTVKSRG
jgi:pilus assembly protein CpaF